MDANKIKSEIGDIRSALYVIEHQIRNDADYSTVEVHLFKPGGKYYTEEQWIVPEGAIGPYDMLRSPDFRRIGGGAVLIPSQEPWGFPHLFPGRNEADEVLSDLVRLKDGPRDADYEEEKPKVWVWARRVVS